MFGINSAAAQAASPSAALSARTLLLLISVSIASLFAGGAILVKAVEYLDGGNGNGSGDIDSGGLDLDHGLLRVRRK